MSHLPSANLMRAMIEACRTVLPEGFGMCILVYPFYDPGISNYISDAERPDMIKLLRETADRLERNQTFPTPEGN